MTVVKKHNSIPTFVTSTEYDDLARNTARVYVSTSCFATSYFTRVTKSQASVIFRVKTNTSKPHHVHTYRNTMNTF